MATDEELNEAFDFMETSKFGGIQVGENFDTENTATLQDPPEIIDVESAFDAMQPETTVDDDITLAEQRVRQHTLKAKEAGFERDELDVETHTFGRLIQASGRRLLGLGGEKGKFSEQLFDLERGLGQLKRKRRLELAVDSQVRAQIGEGWLNEQDLTGEQLDDVLRGDNLAERKARLREYFPNAEVVTVRFQAPAGLAQDRANLGKAPAALNLYKKDSADQWRPLDGTITNWSNTFGFTVDNEAVRTRIFKEITNPQSLGSAAGSIAAAYLTGGASRVSDAARIMTGTFAGSSSGGAVGEGIERAQGLSFETNQQAAGRIMRQATLESIFEGAIPLSVATKNALMNRVFGRGVAPGEHAFEIIEATNRLDATSLPRGLLDENPLEVRAFEQALNSGGQFSRQQKRSIMELLDEARRRIETRALSGLNQDEILTLKADGNPVPPAKGFTDENLALHLLTVDTQMEEGLRRILRIGDAPPTEGAAGAGIQRDLNKWLEERMEFGNKLYQQVFDEFADEARFFSGVSSNIQPITFDINHVRGEAAKLLNGVKAKRGSSDFPTSDQLEQAVAARQAQDAQNAMEPMPVRDAKVEKTLSADELRSREAGDNVKGKTVSGDRTLPQIQEGEPDIADTMLDVSNMEEGFKKLLTQLTEADSAIVSTPEGSAYEIMRNFRNAARRFESSDDPVTRANARRLTALLDDAVSNPSGPQSREFVQRWNRANRYWRAITGRRDLARISQAIRSGKEPFEIVRQFFKPENGPYLRRLKQMLGRGSAQRFEASQSRGLVGQEPVKSQISGIGWEDLRQAYKANLVDQAMTRPDQFLTTLKKMRDNRRSTDEFRRLMFDEGEFEALEEAAKSWSQLTRSPGWKMYKSDLDNAVRGQLLDAQNLPRNVENVQRVGAEIQRLGGLDSPFATAARAHFINQILENPTISFHAKGFGTVINGDRLAAELHRVTKQDPIARQFFRTSDIEDWKREELYMHWIPSKLGGGDALQVAQLAGQKRKIKDQLTFSLRRTAWRSDWIVASMISPGTRRLLERRPITHIGPRTWTTISATNRALTAYWDRHAEARAAAEESKRVREATIGTDQPF